MATVTLCQIDNATNEQYTQDTICLLESAASASVNEMSELYTCYVMS